MRAQWLVAAAAALAAASAQAAGLPDPDRGRLLYENHCVVCHTSKVHRRMPPLPIDMKHLRFIVTVWVRHEGLRWTEQDIEDVVQYLDRTHYRLEK